MNPLYTPAEFALARFRLPMSQSAFARFIGTSRTTIARWETGQSLIPPYVQQYLWLLNHVEGAIDLVRGLDPSPEEQRPKTATRPPTKPAGSAATMGPDGLKPRERPFAPRNRPYRQAPVENAKIPTPGGATTYVEQRPDGGKVEVVKFPHKDRDWMPPGMGDNSLPGQK